MIQQTDDQRIPVLKFQVLTDVSVMNEHEITNKITFSAVGTVHDFMLSDACQLNWCLLTFLQHLYTCSFQILFGNSFSNFRAVYSLRRYKV